MPVNLSARVRRLGVDIAACSCFFLRTVSNECGPPYLIQGPHIDWPCMLLPVYWLESFGIPVVVLWNIDLFHYGHCMAHRLRPNDEEFKVQSN